MTDVDKALQVCEIIVNHLMDDVPLRCEQLADKSFDSPEKQTYRKLAQVYEYLHSVQKGSCYSVHKQWRENLRKTYKAFKKGGLL